MNKSKITQNKILITLWDIGTFKIISIRTTNTNINKNAINMFIGFRFNK